MQRRVINAPSPIRVTRGRVLSPARASRTLLVNGSTDERPDQLVAMRLYMDERLIVSTRQRKVLGCSINSLA
jgi:hypothetical protein